MKISSLILFLICSFPALSMESAVLDPNSSQTEKHDEDQKSKKRKVSRNTEREGNKNKRMKPGTACKSCSGSKKKCDNNKPCGPCKKKGLICEEIITKAKALRMCVNCNFWGKGDCDKQSPCNNCKKYQEENNCQTSCLYLSAFEKSNKSCSLCWSKELKCSGGELCTICESQGIKTPCVYEMISNNNIKQTSDELDCDQQCSNKNSINFIIDKDNNIE